MNKPVPFLFHRRGWLCVLAVACAAAGCSSSTPKAKLTGKVIVGTKNMDGGNLVFVPVSEQDSGGGAAPIDLEGNYSITIMKPGKVKVYISLPPPTPTPPHGKSLGPPKDTPNYSPPPPVHKSTVVVPKKYLNPNSTDKIVDLEPGTHELNIEFK